MKKICLIFAALQFFCLTMVAENFHLTLDESIKIAKEKSYSILRLKQDLKIAEYNLKATTSRLKTHIDLTLNLPQYSQSIISTPDTAGILHFNQNKEWRNYGTLNINQPLPTDGRIFIENYVSDINNLGLSKGDLRSTRIGSSIGIEQPLTALYGYNSIKSTLKRAELAYEQSNKALQREELNLVYQVSSAFYNLLSLQKSAEISQLDLERQTEAFEISKNKYEAGLIREVEALQMEVDLAEAQNNFDIAILNQTSAKLSLKELLGLDLKDSISLNSDLQYKIVIIDPEKAVQYALDNRLEIREQEIQIELQKLNIKQQKTAGMIQTDISASFGKNGFMQGYNLEFQETFKNSYNSFLNTNSYSLGFSIKIPILDWGENRSLVRSAEARLKQNVLRKEEVQREIETEVRNLSANVNSSLKRLQLLEKNVSVAEKSFEITRQRYADGDIDSQALALERNRLNNAYTSHLRAYINYQLTLADLLRKTFYDFRNDELIKNPNGKPGK